MKLSEINWGADSAENDPHLLRYFLDSSAFTRLSNRQKQIVTGRKGSGKSALRKKLAEHFKSQPDTFVLTISPSYTAIRSILNEKDLRSNFGSEVFFQHTWLRQIMTDCLAAIGHDAKGKYAKDSTAFARELASQLNRTSKDLIENITDVLTKVKAKVGDLGDFGVHLERELRNIADVDSLEHHLIEIANSGARFVILIDDLDQGWDNSPTANQMLLGLLLAANSLNSKSASVFPIIFLREDVYSLLMPLTQHADKYRNVEAIRWERDQLIEILSARINTNREDAGLAPMEEAFATVFPDTIGTSYTVNWLTERTLSRPRELLQLARIYTESVDAEIVSDSHLKQAEVGYSEWKINDLGSEFSNQYPGLPHLFSTWKSRLPRSHYHLRGSDLEDAMVVLLAYSPINEPWFNDLATAANTAGLIAILYEIGLLGDYVAGGAAGGARTHYSYMGPHQPRFEEVQVHPCFRKALNTVERNRRPTSSG